MTTSHQEAKVTKQTNKQTETIESKVSEKPLSAFTAPLLLDPI